MNIATVSVRVLRSHDYCHFEVAMTASLEPTDDPTAAADELRKGAARLADRAVKQYRQRKRALQISGDYDTKRLREITLKAEKKAETDRTPEEQAAIKEYRELLHASRFDYQDDWRHPDDDDDDRDDE